MHARRIAPPPGRRLGGGTRRLPAALFAGLAILLAAPLLGGNAPRQEILGIADVAGLTSSPEPKAPGGGMSDPTIAPFLFQGGSVLGRPQAPLVETLDGYQWPIRNARLTQGFGPSRWGTRIVDGEAFHDGLDLATFCGDRIRAAHAGTVLAAGRHFDAFMGWVGDLTAYMDRLDREHLWTTLPIVVVIDDGNGYRSIYAHLRSVAVAPGDVVAAGDTIGWEGATGRASGCHLHYGLFSPMAEATFGFDPVAAAHMLLPTAELARVDPRLVLPPEDVAGIH